MVTGEHRADTTSEKGAATLKDADRAEPDVAKRKREPFVGVRRTVGTWVVGSFATIGADAVDPA